METKQKVYVLHIFITDYDSEDSWFTIHTTKEGAMRALEDELNDVAEFWEEMVCPVDMQTLHHSGYYKINDDNTLTQVQHGWEANFMIHYEPTLFKIAVLNRGSSIDYTLHITKQEVLD